MNNLSHLSEIEKKSNVSLHGNIANKMANAFKMDFGDEDDESANISAVNDEESKPEETKGGLFGKMQGFFSEGPAPSKATLLKSDAEPVGFFGDRKR